MDPRLLSLIRDYQAAVARAVAAMEASGIPRPESDVEWTGYDIPQRGQFADGAQYFAHGFGCAVQLPDTTVDFDFGDEGQIDGFDWTRLAQFAGSKLSAEYGIDGESELRGLYDAALSRGDLVHSGYILSYVADQISDG